VQGGWGREGGGEGGGGGGNRLTKRDDRFLADDMATITKARVFPQQPIHQFLSHVCDHTTQHNNALINLKNSQDNENISKFSCISFSGSNKYSKRLQK